MAGEIDKPDDPQSPGDELGGLTPRQAAAAGELAKGKGVIESARAAGITRQTLHRWMQEPGFIAWVNRWKTLTLESVECQLLAGANDAAGTLVSAAREDYRAAAMLLRGLGRLTPRATGSGDPKILANQSEIDRRDAAAVLDRKAAELDDFESDTARGNFGEHRGKANGDVLRQLQRAIAASKPRRAASEALPPPAGPGGVSEGT